MPSAADPKWFLIDAPVRDAANDAFGHEDVASNLYRMVTEPSDRRRMVGLFGGFGVGKSTVIELLARKLDGAQPHLRLVRMSAERHEPVGFHRAAVYAFAESLVAADEISAARAQQILLPLRVAQTSTLNDLTLSPLYRMVNSARDVLKISWKAFVWWVLAIFVATLLLAIALLWLLPTDVWGRIGAILTSALTGVGLLAPLGWLVSRIRPVIAEAGALAEPGKTSLQTARVEAADEQERTFAELVQQAKHKLVVAVDDIDRLSQDQILDALNAIRSFQLTCPESSRPIFVVSLDESIVRQAISSRETNDLLQPGDEQEFLNRLFTLRQEMPVHERADLRDYALSAIKTRVTALNTSLGASLEDVVSMLIYEGVRDPRHVIRLVNAFAGSFRLALSREGRSGVRSLADRTVTEHPSVLARVTVLRVDFPAFFAALMRDTRLIDAGSAALGLELDQKYADLLVEAGFAPNAPEHRNLFAYLSRTARWAPPVQNIVPFLFLGQNRFSRSLGNRSATTVHDAMVDNIVADLLDAADEASSGVDEQAALQELVVDTLRDLVGGESLNGVSVTIAAATHSDIFVTSNIADVVASTYENDAAIVDGAAGVFRLLSVASPTTAARLARGVLSDASTAPIEEVWSKRLDLERALHRGAVSAWATQRIDEVNTWEEVVTWAALELPQELGSLLIDRSVHLANMQDAEPPQEVVEALMQTRLRLSERLRPASIAELRQLAVRPPNLWSTVLGYLAIDAAELTAPELAAFCGMAIDSNGVLDEGDLPVALLVPLLIELARRASREAADLTAGNAAGIPAAAAPVAVLASWEAEGPAQATEIAAALDCLLDAGLSGQQPAVEALFSAWEDDPAGSDNQGNTLEGTLTSLSARLDSLDGEARLLLRTRFAEALLQPDIQEEAARVVLPFVRRPEAEEWADEYVMGLAAEISQSAVRSPNLLSVAAVLVSAGVVGDDAQNAVADKLERLMQYGQSQPWALGAVGLFRWSSTVVQRISSIVGPYVGQLDDAVFWALFDQQTDAGAFAGAFLDRATELTDMSGQELNQAVADRAAVLARVLPLEPAVRIALRSGNEDSIGVAAKRPSDVDEILLTLRLAASASSRSSAESYVRGVAAAAPQAYTEAVDHLLSATLDVDSVSSRDVWRFATVPLSDGDRGALWTRVRESLTGTVEQAQLATKVLPAVEFDPAMDELVETAIAEVMRVWIVEHPTPVIAQNITRAVREGAKSSARALSSWKRKPRSSEAVEAFEAAAAALTD